MRTCTLEVSVQYRVPIQVSYQFDMVMHALHHMDTLALYRYPSIIASGTCQITGEVLMQWSTLKWALHEFLTKACVNAEWLIII